MTGQEQPSNSDAAGSDTQSEQAQPAQKATVLESLNNGLFRLQMNDGRPVVAHVAKDLRMALSRLLPGDSVLVDVSPYDPGKARICKLLAQ
jgi:translation initiation factor IF-1